MCISDTKGSHADLTDDYAAIRREMESAVTLSVPLSVDLTVGDTWYENK